MDYVNQERTVISELQQYLFIIAGTFVSNVRVVTPLVSPSTTALTPTAAPVDQKRRMQRARKMLTSSTT